MSDAGNSPHDQMLGCVASNHCQMTGDCIGVAPLCHSLEDSFPPKASCATFDVNISFCPVTSFLSLILSAQYNAKSSCAMDPQITNHAQAFENTSTNVAAAQMRNALTNLAESVEDPKQKKV